MQTIAKIKLSSGNVGWYEPLSRIHLTLSNPIAEVKAGTKLEGIRKSLAYGTIILLEGSVDEEEILDIVSEVKTLSITEEQFEDQIEELSEKVIKEPALDEKPKKASKKKTKA